MLGNIGDLIPLFYLSFGIAVVITFKKSIPSILTASSFGIFFLIHILSIVFNYSFSVPIELVEDVYIDLNSLLKLIGLTFFLVAIINVNPIKKTNEESQVSKYPVHTDVTYSLPKIWTGYIILTISQLVTAFIDLFQQSDSEPTKRGH